MNATREQMSIFDLMREERAKSITPKLQVGQTVFLLSIDIVCQRVVTSAWLISRREHEPHYNYRVEGDENNVVSDCDIGNIVFLNRTDAERKASEIRRQIETINPLELELSELQSYEYIRELDNHKLQAAIAKVGSNKLFEHNYMCFHFLRTYDTQKKRDVAYKKLALKIAEENERYGAVAVEQPDLDVLYKVNDNLYASRGYAKNHSENPVIRMSGDWVYRS